MFRFNFDFEETVQQTPTDCSQQEEVRATPAEESSVTPAEDRPVATGSTETVRNMQAEIALFHGEAIAFIARYLQKHYGKTYWQAQDEATTVWNILRKNQIRQALAEGRDDAAERLLAECREKFGMPDYLATSRTNWPESPCIH